MISSTMVSLYLQREQLIYIMIINCWCRYYNRQSKSVQKMFTWLIEIISIFDKFFQAPEVIWRHFWLLCQAYKFLKHVGDASYKESIAVFFEKAEHRSVDTLSQHYIELIPIIIMDLYDSMTHNPVPDNLHIIRYT